MSTVPCSWANIHRHSIFALPSQHGNGADKKQDADDRWQVVNKPNEGDGDDDSVYEDADEVVVGSKKQRIAVRDNDLLVAVGKELRVVSLSGESWPVKNGQVGSYKRLTAPQLDFDIHTLLLNPTRRLLAVVGRTQLAVVILPKTGWSAGPGEIRVRAIVIDSYNFSPSSPTPITNVLWHPLGEGGQSLWVLTADAKLREYDLRTPSDPAQTFSLVSSLKKSSGFSAIDPLSQYATSFTFSPPASKINPGWGEMAIHVLMANSDIYTLCPVLPLRTSIPLRSIQRLKAYLQLQGTVDELKWIDELVKQVPPASASSGAGALPRTPPRGFLSRSILAARKAQADELSEKDGERIIALHPPHLNEGGGPASGTHMLVKKQGPAPLDPAPVEGDEEDVAVDLILVDVPAVPPKDNNAQPDAPASNPAVDVSLQVIGIAWSSGRVDFGVQADSVNGAWVGDQASAGHVSDPLSFAIVDAIQLGTSPAAGNDAPAFALDPMSAETVYVQSGTGVVQVKIRDWATSLLKDDAAPLAVERLASSKRSLEGVLSLTNVSLGYGLISLSSTGQVGAVEFNDPYAVQVVETDAAPTSLLPARSGPIDPGTMVDPHCLLNSHTFAYQDSLKAVAPPAGLKSARIALSALPSAGQRINSISAEQTRALIGMMAPLHAYAQALRAESRALERYLDVQVQEYQRQLAALKRSSEAVEALKERRLQERVQQMEQEQQSLNERMERVVKSMQEDFRPKAGQAERRWFKEVRELDVRVKGNQRDSAGEIGVGRGASLQQRVKLAREQLEAIKTARLPSREAETGDHRAALAALDAEGSSGLRPLEDALAQRLAEMQQLMDKVQNLSLRVESALDGSGSRTEG